MTEFSALLQQGNAWLFIPSAVLLGALHGLEPGHSKTLMAAFIVAVRGTVTQAILLGLAATISHTAIVWIVAMAGLYFSSHLNAEESEPYFQLASAVIIIGVAVWMIWRTWQEQHTCFSGHGHEHGHGHGHDHGHKHDHRHPGESPFQPLQRPSSGWGVTAPDINRHGSVVVDPVYQDAHELAHANDIRRRFTGKEVTTGQIVLFGLTGGLIPCPASITVLLLCLQLKEVALGATLVLSFSIGLALTLVASGMLAALSVKHASKRWSGFGEFMRKAPYFSGGLILLVGLYVGYHGWQGLI